MTTVQRRTRVLALANQKGGVGKTTTAINLGTALAAIGERVLIVDLDPQGNASTGLGIDERRHSTADVLAGKVPFAAGARRDQRAGPRRGAGHHRPHGLRARIRWRRPGRHYRLRDAIASMLAAEEPDKATTYVLIDCPPSLNLLTVNALAAADAVLVPLQCEFFALEGLAQLLSTVEEIRVRLNPKLQIHGVVLTMYDQRTSLADQVVDDVRRVLGDKVYATIIPRNVRVAELPSHGKPVLLYDYRCSGSQAYIRLASEVIERERRMRAA